MQRRAKINYGNLLLSLSDAVAGIFTAIAEDRPYRKSMNKDEIHAVFNDLILKRLLDGKIANILFNNYNMVMSHVKETRDKAHKFYENQFKVAVH
jgi:HD-GYP domain-containing protein (c-di-GMP phosphodiesterase class II)